MPTESALEATRILHDGSQFQWYVIPLYIISFWVYDMPTMKKKIITTGVIYSVDLFAIALFGFILGWI